MPVFEISIPKISDEVTRRIAETPGKAKAAVLRNLKDVWPSIGFTDIKVRRAPTFERIERAAIQIEPRRENDLPVVLSVANPGRHHHIVHTMARAGLPTPIGCLEQGHTQGFLTSQGRFVNRVEALEIAREAGQVTTIIGGELTSEDLW